MIPRRAYPLERPCIATHNRETATLVTAAKKDTVAHLNEAFQRAPLLLIASYQGLKVAEMQRLRRDVRSTGGVVQVAKNTLVKIAFDGTPYKGLSNYLKGQNLFIYSESAEADPVVTSRTVVEFSQSTDKFKLVVGKLGHHVLEPADVKALAELPSLDELRARLIGLIQAPSAKIAQLVSAPASGVSRAVAAFAELPEEERSRIILAAKAAATEAKVAASEPGFAVGPPELSSLEPMPSTVAIELEALPSGIARRLMSDDVGQRISGIREAGKHIRSLNGKDEMGSAKPLHASEAFEASTLTSRLYNCLFSDNAEEAREAAYALVVNAPRLRGKLDPSRALTDLSAQEWAEFRKGLLKLFADAKLHYFSYVDAVWHEGKKPGELDVHVTVRISRRVPFTLDDEPLYLQVGKVVSDDLVIGSPLADTVKEIVVHQPKDGEEGIVAQGETHMTVRVDRLTGPKVPIVIGFGPCVDTINVAVPS